MTWTADAEFVTFLWKCTMPALLLLMGWLMATLLWLWAPR